MSKGNRIWLNNEPTETAFMSWSVDTDGGALEIADCNRKISLDFYVHGSRERQRKLRDRLKKLLKFEAEIAKFRAALEEQVK